MPRSPGGRLDPGRLVGARIDWSGAPRARQTRLAARSAWFGIGVVGSYGTFYQQQFFPLTGDDALGTSDAASQATALVPRTASDSLGTSDSAAGAVARTRSASDSLGTSDDATSAVNRVRSAADSLGSSDAAARAPLTQARTASDALYNTYDPVVDADPVTSHWKLGSAASAVDRKGVTNLPRVGGGLAVVPGITANAGPSLANQAVGTVGAGFDAGSGAGQGTPYQGPHTLEAWVGPIADFGGFALVRTPGTYIGMVGLGAGHVWPIFGYEDSVGGQASLSDVAGVSWMNLGGAYHLVGTHDGSTVILYLNGVEIKRASGVNGTRSATTLPPHIIDARAGVWPRAVVDEVAWYSGALSAARVLAHYQAGTGAPVVDFATRTTAQPRSASDTLGTSDAATRTTAQPRTASDALGTSDAAARAPLTQARTATDALYNTYDPVIDADPVTSHWKLGGSTSAVDRKGVADLPSTGAGLAVVPGITANAGPSLANQAVGTAGARFLNSGDGTAYEGPYTMEAWVKPTADFNGAIFVRGAATYLGLTQDGRGTFVGADFSFENSAGAQTRRVSTLNVGSIYHLAITHDGSTVVMYVNGAEVNRVTGVSGNRSIPTSIPNIVGPSAGVWPRAVVDEVAWYSGALSAARVLAHYQAGTGAPVVDFATRALAQPRSASDTLGTSDAAVATTAGVPTRTAADSLGTSDAATRAPVVPTRSAADNLGTTDAAARAIVQARTASDTAGHGNGQSDQLNTDTRASYSAFAAGAPDWSGTGWQTGGKSAGYYLMAAPVAWGNGDDTIKVRARLIVFGSLAPVGVGFVKPGSVAQGSVLLAEIFNGSLKLAYDGPYNVGGGVTITSISIPGYAGGNYFVVEMTRAGNSVVLGVRNAADSAVVLADQTVALPVGAQAGYGAGVALRPMLSLANQSSTGTGADWWEFGSPADVATRVLALVPRTTADALGTTDAATRTTAQPRSASDSLGTSDAATRTVAQPRSAADSLGTTDAATRTAARSRTAVDSLGSSDVATRTTAQPRTATDTLGTSDAATRALAARVRSATDTLGTSDAATQARTLQRTAADVVGSSDVAVRATTVRSRFASDTLGTSDVAVSTPLRLASDVLGTSDAATRAPTIRGRSASDTLGSSDAATRAAIAGARSSSDVLGSDDLATQVASYARFSDDVLGSSDVATQAVSFGRLASDTLGTDDQAERFVTVSFRFAADELGTSDSALAFIPRFASDTLGTSDAATVVLQAQVLGTVLVSDSPSSLLAISDYPQLELALSSSALTIFDEPA